MGGATQRENANIPHFVGRYEILVPIASGGMATVYLARSRGAGGFAREVAIKLTHAHLRESTEFQSLLVEEAKVASAIRHHNVVSVLDVGDDPHGLFLVMDYVEGDTLSGLVRRARAVGDPMRRPLGMRVLLDALAGLHAAHETLDAEGKPLQIVHRDFSPQNVLVGVDGVAKLTDFGIAKAASRAGNTSTGILKGKIAYMSPEQARGTALDRRADVWAAGVLAWEIVTGKPLWPREDADVSTLIKLVTTPPPRLREVDPKVSEALDEAVGKALAMDPEERWPSAGAFAKALAAATETADVDEVALWVRTLTGPKLEQRREQIRSMGALRAKMGEITEASVMTPSGEHVRALTPPGPSAPPVVARPEDATEIIESPAFGAPAPPPASVPSPAGAPPTRRPPRWAVPAALAVVGLALLLVAIAAALHRPRSAGDGAASTTAAATSTPTPAPTKSKPEPPTATATAMATATPTPTLTLTPTPTPTPTPTLTPAPTPTPTPTLTAPAPKLQHPHPHHPSASPTSTSKLAPSPY